MKCCVNMFFRVSRKEYWHKPMEGFQEEIFFELAYGGRQCTVMLETMLKAVMYVKEWENHSEEMICH